MKKNDWVLLLTVLFYSFLFYQQAAGINFIFFNVVLLAGLVIKNPQILKSKSWIFYATGAIISSVCIGIYSSPIAIVANIISLSIVSVTSFSSHTSVLTSIFLSVCSMGSSVVMMFIDMYNRERSQLSQGIKRPFYVRFLIFLIVFIIIILFFSLYRTSNPLFKDFTKNINLDFISIPWIFFTLGGLLLIYGFYYNRHLGSFTNKEHLQSNDLSQEKAQEQSFLNRLFKEETELVTGTLLFVSLNILLLLLNVLDLNYLWFNGKLPEGIQHKEFVHDGVGTLITSILFAIFIILYFFRGRLNYHPKVKIIRMLTYIWIIQNAFMIFSTSYRMNMYVDESGISYKKIGVYVYLTLTLLGLMTTYIKVSKQKSNWYLFRINPRFYYSILLISCTVNWDVLITRFNINKAITENKELEKYYLVDLSFKNIPDLILLNDTIKAYDDFEARDYYFASRGTYFYSFKSALDKKIFDFLDDYLNYSSWRSMSLEKHRVYNDVLSLNERHLIKSMQLNNNYAFTHLEALKLLSNLEVIEINNSTIKRMDDFSAFPNLKQLSLRSNQIDSLEKFPNLNYLESLDLSDNHLNSLSSLINAPHLKKLNLDNIYKSDINTLPVLQHLEQLYLNSNPVMDYSRLAIYKNLRHLSISNSFSGKVESFPRIEQLAILEISKNELTNELTEEFFSKLRVNSELKNLNMSANLLTNLYCFIEPNYSQAIFPKLTSLNLSYNKLYTLAGVGVHTQLTELLLGSNQIKDIEPLFKLEKLKTLDLESNLLTSIEGIEQIKELEYLNLSNNNLRKGITSISELKNLKHLNLSSTSLLKIDFLGELKNLKSLNIANNKIKNPSLLQNLIQLESLDISNNAITDFTFLKSLKNLKSLSLSTNNDEEFDHLKKQLPNCKISNHQ